MNGAPKNPSAAEDNHPTASPDVANDGSVTARSAEIHLITVLDDEIDNHGKFRTVVKSAQDDAIITLDPDAVNLFNSLRRLERLRDLGAPDIVMAKEEQLIKKYRRSAEKSMDGAILQRIMESRIKVHLLIDSVGGCQMEGHPFSAMSDMAVETVAYVTREASSLACNMTLAADRAYCLKDSYILWHLGKDNELLLQGASKQDRRHRMAFKKEEDENTHQIFRDMMERRCRPNNKNRLMDKIDASSGNEDREVVFSGKELASCGIVEKAYGSTRLLSKKFCMETGIDGTAVQKAPAIGDFFNLAYFSEALSRAVGFNCGLRRIGETGEIAFRIVDNNLDTPENREMVRLTGSIIMMNQAGR